MTEEIERKVKLNEDWIPLYGPSLDSTVIAVNPADIKDVKKDALLEGGFTKYSGVFPDTTIRTFYLATPMAKSEAANDIEGGE